MEQGGAVIGTAPVGTVGLAFDGEAIPIASDGRFLIAFDRDHGPTAVLEATLADGRRVTRSLAVAPRRWDISRLGRLPQYRTEAPTSEPQPLMRISYAVFFVQ